MKYTIYKVTNKLNNKIYIGKHQTKNVNDEYYGSGKLISNAIKKYGKQNFSKEVLFVYDTEEEMNAKEKELITEEFVKRKDTYNIGVGGEGGPHFKGKTHSKEVREKIKTTLKNLWLENTEIREARKNKYKSGDIIPWNKGKTGVISDEHKQKISEYRSGRRQSPETIEKIRKARAKQVFSEETRKKMSESAKNRKS